MPRLLCFDCQVWIFIFKNLKYTSSVFWNVQFKYSIHFWPGGKKMSSLRYSFRKRFVIGQTRADPAFGWIWLARWQARVVGWWLSNKYSYDRSARSCLAHFTRSGSSDQNVGSDDATLPQLCSEDKSSSISSYPCTSQGKFRLGWVDIDELTGSFCA